MKRLLADPASKKKTRVEVTTAAQVCFNRWIQRRLQGLVYSEKVPNWYIDRRTGRNTLIWPGSQAEFWWSRCIKPVRWADFDVEVRG
jgi:hypothetical protein